MEKLVNKKVKLDLTTPDSNIYSLIGAWQMQAKKERWTREEIDIITQACFNADGYDEVLLILQVHSVDGGIPEMDFDEDEEELAEWKNEIENEEHLHDIDDHDEDKPLYKKLITNDDEDDIDYKNSLNQDV